ncbi:MAG TPA: SusC/RagA family protein, partial [Rikenellaceae bacterium]|nr:SusC/RagA family protein [Rikenellaceae bacterium]
MKSNCLQNSKLYVVLLLCVGFFSLALDTASAQVNADTMSRQKSEITVKGDVSDADGPVIGAFVYEKTNKANGTMTDVDGRFTLKVPDGAVLVVSCIGSETLEVRAVSGQDMRLLLKPDTSLLDEVVVVGFGVQKKVNMTGSVSVADQEALKDRPVTSAAQALQGVVPGLQITSADGKLETNASINIRGNGTIGSGSSGSPLILIDGMEGDINAVNPQDIESISVLKDAASASIYGSRAPFGVILVTTKKGSQGKATISYNNSFRFSNLVNRNHTMDSRAFALFFDDACVNTPGWGPHFSKETIEKIEQYQAGTLLNSKGVFDPLYTMDDIYGNGNWQDVPYHGGAWANTDWFSA